MKKIFERILAFVGGMVKRNFGWKLCSFLFAIFAWFIVMNIINPVEEKVYTVELTLGNEDKLSQSSIVLLNRSALLQTKVDIRVRATRSDLDILDKKENAEKIVAVADLNQFDLIYSESTNGAVNVSVTPNLSQERSGYQIVNFSPMTVGVNFDRYITVTKDVHVNSHGKVADGYVSGELTCTPATLDITAPSTVIADISQISVDFDYANATENVKQTLVPKAYNAEGVEVTGISLSSFEVTVSADVSNRGMAEIVQPHTKGEPASGYVISDITYSPKMIEITGDKENVDLLKQIKMNDFDISGSSYSRTFKYDISPYLKSYGVQAKNSDDTIITVTVNIEKKTSKTVNFDTEKIILNGKNNDIYNYAVVQETPMEISGRSEDISKLDTSALTAICAVSELGAGKHSVVATVSISPELNVNIDAVPVFLVTVTNKTEGTTESVSSAAGDVDTDVETDVKETVTEVTSEETT